LVLRVPPAFSDIRPRNVSPCISPDPTQDSPKNKPFQCEVMLAATTTSTGPVFHREKVFSSRPVTPATSSGFRAMGKAGRARRHHRWPLAAILSILFALACALPLPSFSRPGLRYTIHNWHHPDDPSRSLCRCSLSPSCSAHGIASAAGRNRSVY
jgi:hypothetical protein